MNFNENGDGGGGVEKEKVAANASPKIKKALAVPKGKRVAMTLVLGYPAVKFLRSPPRKALDVRYM